MTTRVGPQVNPAGAGPIEQEMQHNAVFPVRCAVALAATLVLGACGGGPSVASGTDPIPAGTTVASTPPPMPGGRSCANPSPIRPTQHGLEAQGTMRGGGVASALFTGVGALAAGEPIPTYWRVGGGGALKITLVGPSDRIVRVSGVRPGVPPFTWDPPGEPWQSTLTFPQPGCWRIYLVRGGTDGEVWVRVS